MIGYHSCFAHWVLCIDGGGTRGIVPLNPKHLGSFQNWDQGSTFLNVGASFVPALCAPRPFPSPLFGCGSWPPFPLPLAGQPRLPPPLWYSPSFISDMPSGSGAACFVCCGRSSICVAC